MSLFIGALAFAASPVLQEEAKVGILFGSLLAGLFGYAVLARGGNGRHSSETPLGKGARTCRFE